MNVPSQTIYIWRHEKFIKNKVGKLTTKMKITKRGPMYFEQLLNWKNLKIL